MGFCSNSNFEEKNWLKTKSYKQILTIKKLKTHKKLLSQNVAEIFDIDPLISGLIHGAHESNNEQSKNTF